MPPDAPLGGMARPNLLVGGSYYCDARYKLYQALARYQDVPCYTLDVANPPTNADPEAIQHYISYQVEELRYLIAYLETTFGRKMDWDKFCEVMDTTEKSVRLWLEIQELRKAVPCPMAAQDTWACMGPYFWMPGEKESLEFCQELYKEIKYRVENGIGAIPNEKYRLLFIELPLWHSLGLLNYLESLGALSVMESALYYPGPPAPEGISDPLERLAWLSKSYDSKGRLFDPQARAEARDSKKSWLMLKYLDWAQEYQLDGAVLHYLLSCRAASVELTHVKNVLLREVQIPSLRIESDVVDVRTFPEAEVKGQAEAFVEVMDHYKKIRQQKGLPVAHPT